MAPAFPPRWGQFLVWNLHYKPRKSRKPIPALVVETRPQIAATVTAMDHAFLCVVCSGLIVLVTAFALATPSIKSAQPQADEAVLVHLLGHPPCHSAKTRC